MQTDNFSEKRAKIWFSPNILQIAITKKYLENRKHRTLQDQRFVRSQTNRDSKLSKWKSQTSVRQLTQFWTHKMFVKKAEIAIFVFLCCHSWQISLLSCGPYERLFFESVNLSRLVYSLNVSPRDHRFPHSVTSSSCRKQFVPNKLS